MNEIYIIEFEVKTNKITGEYKKVESTAVDIVLGQHYFRFFEYSTGEVFEYDLKNIKNLIIKQL